MDMPLSRVSLAAMYPTGVRPMSVHLIDIHLMGGPLIDVHLMGVPLIACLS